MIHTPGPWDIRLTRHADCEGGDGRGFSRFVIAAPSGAAIQGSIAMTPLRYAEFEAADKSNASLIAAAPELLAALNRVVDAIITGCDWQSGNIPGLERAIEDASKAIDRAEGRHPCEPTGG